MRKRHYYSFCAFGYAALLVSIILPLFQGPCGFATAIAIPIVVSGACEVWFWLRE